MILKIFSFISLTLLTLFLLWGLGWLWFATSIALTTPEQEEIKTDAVVVLTGGNGRITAGLNLLERQTAPKIFISGVNENVIKEDIYANWHKSTAVKTNNKPCCVYLGYEAKDTAGNALETKNWVLKNNISSFRLVTSSYHMPRAYLEISKILPEIKIIPHPVFSNDFKSWEGRFWSLTFSEYNKTLVRWLRLRHEQKAL